jgi:hypothetical protein
MKNYLAGFGIIMAVGLAFALSGSNGASNLLATILDVATFSTTTPNTATTTIITDTTVTDGTVNNTTTSTATTITTSSTTTTTTTTSGTVAKLLPAASTTVRTALLSGLIADQLVQGLQILGVYANDGPISAQFIITNLQSSASISIDATCIVDTAAHELPGKCTGEMGTITMANGKYSVKARVKYADGEVITSDQVYIYVNNVRPLLVFTTPLGNSVSGTISIGGEISTATEVEFLYVPTGGTQGIRIGSGIYAGGITVSKWTYEWDTTLVPNGTYKVIANAKSRYSNGESYKAGEMTISIFNKVSTESVSTVYPTTTAPVAEVIQKITVPTPAPSIEELTRSMTAGEPKETGIVPQSSTERRAVEYGMTVPGWGSAPTAQNVEQNIGTRSDIREQATQSAPNTAPVSPVVQRIQDIAIGLQGGSDSTTIGRKVDALQKELWGEVNPASPTVQANMQYQSAKEFGTTVNTTVMRVATIALSTTTAETIVSVATTTAKGEKVIIKEKRQVVKEKVRLTGKALPNMYVTLYIYSEVPTIAVVKADRNGNWVYELNNKLADGRHEAYVTINDHTGKVVAKSALFGFVKTAEAVTVENSGLANLGSLSDEPIQPVQAARRTYALVVFTIIGLGLLIGVFLVVRSFRSKNQNLI